MKRLFIFLLTTLTLNAFSQNTDSLVLRKIFENAITNNEAYNNLHYLCTNTPGRLMGSENSIKALKYLKNYLESLDCDSVYLQEYKTDAWKYNSSQASLLSADTNFELSITALGPSASTPEDGITAEVVEVNGIQELKQMKREDIEGKIVFFNRPVDPTFIETFPMYGDAVDQRARGPQTAAEMGAVAALVRSVTTLNDDNPHTGNTHLSGKKIAAAGIGIISADKLSNLLKKDKTLKVEIKIDAEELTDITTYNLIAEIRGNEKPDEIIVLGGHIDSWFNAPGAHDDGAGVVQTADVIRIFKQLKIKNKRTIRFVAFMDEEYSQSGSKYYASSIDTSEEKHFFALEADAGGFTPTGFTMRAKPEQLDKISSFKPLLSPYGIKFIRKGGAGVDIYPLRHFNIPLVEFRTDSQRYFDLHHSANDSFDKVNFRELQLGSSCLAGLVFLVDKYGDW
jgi:hypothetical protein